MKLRLIFSCCVVAIATAMTGCGMTGGYNLPPASRLMEPGPGVGGPGPGVMSMPTPMIQQASHVVAADSGGVAASEVQVLFARPESMQISFDAGGSYDSTPIIAPGRQNFVQGGVYRLKVTGVPGREGTELYPTLEIGPPTRQTAAYLAHNAIPVQFTEEDFDQVLSGNFVTKVIYLPEPDFQELALAGVETLVSTRLDPGMDPIIEANRRGAILAVVRVGNKDMEIPGSSEAGAVQTASAIGSALGGVQPIGTSIGPGAIQQTGLGCNSCSTCVDGSCGGVAGGMPPGMVGAGQYGMPITGTPIALPGPPHIPLGTPAGLKQHVMRNHTKRHLPDPVGKLQINVKQRPGLSYPVPPNRVRIVEDTIHSAPHFGGSARKGGLLGGLFGH